MARRTRLAPLLTAVLVAAPAVTLAQTAADPAVQSQWFTGSLEAPSPALSKAGQNSVEPYLIYNHDTGAYDARGRRRSGADDLNQLQSETSLKYAFTDQLTVQALPSLSRSWTRHAASTGVGDLPVELEYRFNQQNAKTGSPSLTAALGVRLLTGAYDHLGAAIDGYGTGAYTVKGGLLLQSLFDTWGGHPVRLRLYGAAFTPLAQVTVRDLSVYGTLPGFRGRAARGFASELGLGAGYALDQRWVLALDVLRDDAAGARLDGRDGAGLAVALRGGRSISTVVAPAIEYNWSSRIGLIAGVAFTAAGRNTASYLAPQIALATSF